MTVPEFKNIGLVGRPDHAGVVSSLERLMSYLNKKDLHIITDIGTAKLLENPPPEIVSKTEIFHLVFAVLE